MIKWIKRGLLLLLALAVLGAAGIFGVNAYVKAVAEEGILALTDPMPEEIDCILVLGCHVQSPGNPSDMLADRLERGVELYRMGAAPKLLMSGDHGQTSYDEVNTMKQYAVDEGIASEDVFMDHAGFSTYESMYRAKEVFGVKRVIIVTQGYHLYRAVYIARKLGLEAWGVASDQHTYGGQTYRDVREVLARCKDFATTVIKPEPTFLGETIPISGSGELTND